MKDSEWIRATARGILAAGLITGAILSAWAIAAGCFGVVPLGIR